MPPGSAESLRLSYKTAFSQLVQDYASYLRRNIRETPALGTHRPIAAQTGGQALEATTSHHLTDNGSEQEPSETNGTGVAVCVEVVVGNVSLACLKGQLNRTTIDVHNSTTATNQVPTLTRGFNEVIGHTGPTDTNVAVGSKRGGGAEHATASEGLLVIEAMRNVSHSVQHHACESPAIEQALATRLLDAQDLEESRDFFQYSQMLFNHLLGQRGDFDLKIRWRKTM